MSEKEKRRSSKCLMDWATRRVSREESAAVAADKTLIQFSAIKRHCLFREGYVGMVVLPYGSREGKKE